MKANELMLGDWVAFRKDFPDRVNAIAIGGHAVSLEHDSWQQMCSIQPIPITPEILKKNGFVQCEPQGYDLYAKDKKGKGLYHILWQSEPYDYLEIAAYTAAFGEFNKSSIRYVHQLQHTLRLCGIEKDIVL